MLVLVLGNLSQSFWWASPALVTEHGLGFTSVAVALAVLTLVGLLFQAERLLLYAYNPFALSESASLFPPVRSPWLNLFLFSALIGGVLLASHHMLVASWQSNLLVSLYTEQGTFPNFPLLLASQQQLIGGFGEQLLWLLYVLGGLMLIALVLTMRLIFVWVLVLLVLDLLLVFGFLFVHELPLPSLLEELPSSDYLFFDGFVLVLETSLAGFGLVFACSRWRGHAAQAGWLLCMLVLLGAGYVLHLIAAWQFARFTWVGETPGSDRLLLHLPYVFYQSGSDWLYWAWFALTAMLAWIKTGAILLFGAVIIARLARVSIASTQLMLVILVGFLTLCWLAIGHFGQGAEQNAMTLLFELLFEGFMTLWYPLHVLLLCSLALAVPTEDHAVFVWREYRVLGLLLRFGYVPLMAFLLWYLLDLAGVPLPVSFQL